MIRQSRARIVKEGVRYSCVETRYYIVGSKRIRNIPATKFVARDSPTLQEIGEMISDHHNSKQQEYRVLAHFSQEQSLIETYQRGEDLYAQVASEIFEKDIDECRGDSPYRKQTKVILLAIAYGTAAGTLSLQLGKSRAEAQRILNDFKKKYPILQDWIEGNKAYVQANGYVWMHAEQRKRRLPAAKNRDHDDWYRSVHTQSTNAIIQGSASIQTKVTLIELHKLCQKYDGWKLLATIHDEIILEVPDTVTQEQVNEIKHIMEHSYVFGDVPNKTDIEFYKRWSEPITYEEWFE